MNCVLKVRRTPYNATSTGEEWRNYTAGVFIDCNQASIELLGTRPGTGLGLLLVKRCADLHGGIVQLESKIGEGTNVTVKFRPFPVQACITYLGINKLSDPGLERARSEFRRDSRDR